ncbi:hypothetical protein BH11VER1_BH11VER1_28340 [soil metagenome]
MNFLFPFYMLGALAVAIPIMLHFRRQPPQKAVPFSTLMFLEQTPVPPKTKRKLEDWLLLALRCLTLLLLALMFSRPFLRSVALSSGSSSSNWCVLIDVSASMRREGAWPELEKQLQETLRSVKEDDQACVIVFDREAKIIFGFDAWKNTVPGSRKAALAQVIKKIQPGWSNTDLGKALVFGSEQLTGLDDTAPKRLVLISDMQEGAALEALHAGTWPDEVTLTLMPVKAPWQDNLTLSPASVATVADAESVSTRNTSASNAVEQLRVRVTNGRDSAIEKFSLVWKGGGEKLESTVPAGGSRILLAPARPSSSTEGVLMLQGDKFDFDNQWSMASSHPREIKVLAVGMKLTRKETASPLFYLSRALQPTAALQPLIIEKEPTNLQQADVLGSDLILVFGETEETAAALLQKALEAGRSIVYVAQEGDRGSMLNQLCQTTGITLSEASTKDALLQDLQFDHPLLQGFAEAGVRDFTKVRSWKHRLLQLPASLTDQAQIIARFDDGAVAWAEIPAAKGRILYLASSWTPSDSQLAVSSKYVPWLYAMLNWAVGDAMEQQGWMVDDAIPASVGPWTGSIPVKIPEGHIVNWDTTAPFTATTEPGIYQMGEGEKARSIAVNLSANEGRLAPMEITKLKELGVKTEAFLASSSAAVALSQRQMEDYEHELHQKGWKFLLLAAIVILLIETWLAGRLGSRNQEPAIPT